MMKRKEWFQSAFEQLRFVFVIDKESRANISPPFVLFTDKAFIQAYYKLEQLHLRYIAIIPAPDGGSSVVGHPIPVSYSEDFATESKTLDFRIDY